MLTPGFGTLDSRSYNDLMAPVLEDGMRALRENYYNMQKDRWDRELENKRLNEDRELKRKIEDAEWMRNYKERELAARQKESDAIRDYRNKNLEIARQKLIDKRGKN